MLTYAIDRPAPATIILISGDRDFAYAASVLRLRRYSVVVISLTNPGAHQSLKAQANTCLDWNDDIMGKVAQRHEPALSEGIGSPTVNKPWSNPVSNAAEILLAPSAHKRVNKPTRAIHHKKDNSVNRCRSMQAAIAIDDTTQTHDSSPDELLEDMLLPGVLTLENISSTEDVPSASPFSPPPPSPRNEVEIPSPTDASLVSVVPRPVNAVDPEGVKEGTGALDEFPLPGIMSQRGEASKKLVSLYDSDEYEEGSQSLDRTSTKAYGSLNSDGLSDVDGTPIFYPQAPPSSASWRDTAGCRGVPLAKTLGKTEASLLEAVPVTTSDDTLVPSYFILLVRILLRYRAEGIYMASRSKVAVKLMANDNTIYAQAGVETFGEYASLARSSGLVDLGTSESGEPWISLAAPVTLTSGHPSTSTTEQRIWAPCRLSDFHLPTLRPSQPSTTPEPARPKVASHFWPLIEVLEEHRTRGILRPLRSVVAQELQRHDVYKKAGVTKFREYIALAESAEIVTLGGTDGRDWVSFDSDWLQSYG